MTTNPMHAQEKEWMARERETFPGSSAQPMVPQDSYRRVLFGQASDPLFPPHPEPAEVPESVLSELALRDTAPAEVEGDRPGTPLLRWLLLAGIAVIALGLLSYLRLW